MSNEPVGETAGGADGLAVRRVVDDSMVRGQDDHHVTRITIDPERRQRDRGSRVATRGLDEDSDLGQLLAGHLRVAPVGDDRDVLGGERQIRMPDDAVDRQLQERPLAEQRQEGLRGLGAAQGPQPGSPATGQDHGVHRHPCYRASAAAARRSLRRTAA